MFRVLRRHINATSILAVLAVLLATTGGAYAAGVIKITSIHQISSKVVKQLHGKTGTQGPLGPQGPKGDSGAQGPGGALGQPGTNGVSVTSEEVKVGEERCNKVGGAEYTSVSGKVDICTGKTGKDGPPGPFLTELPEGATEVGIWSFGLTGDSLIFVPVASFTFPLAAPLDGSHVHILNESLEELHAEAGEQLPNTTPTECGAAVGGTLAEPKAASGNLCIYIGALAGAITGSEQITGPDGNPGASKEGAILLLNGAGSAFGRGTWAVTG